MAHATPPTDPTQRTPHCLTVTVPTYRHRSFQESASGTLGHGHKSERNGGAHPSPRPCAIVVTIAHDDLRIARKCPKNEVKNLQSAGIAVSPFARFGQRTRRARRFGRRQYAITGTYPVVALGDVPVVALTPL